MSSRALALATRDLLAASMNARARLGATDLDLVTQLSTAIGAADKALREHEIQEMLDERNRRQISELAGRRRKGFQP